MKPLNTNEPGCNPISSNCVIWQGPDIPCLSLCKGDTVTDVVYKLGTDFCDLVSKTLNINVYDLTEFQLSICQPNDFKTLIQFMLNRIRSLEECTGCIPDCNGDATMPESTELPCCQEEIMIAACMHHTDLNGNAVIQMPLIDYLIYMGQVVCEHTHDIETQATVNNTMNAKIANAENNITNLQNEPPPEYPLVPATCVLPAGQYPVDQVVNALEVAFCQLQYMTGDPVNIGNGIAKQGSVESYNKLAGSGTLGSIPGWVSPVMTLGDSVSNLWLAYQDMYTAIRNIQLNCCPSGCDGVEVSITASVDGTNLIIYVNGTIPTGFVECNGTGTTFTITDAMGNTANVTFNLTTYIGNPSGYTFNLATTSVNPGSDLTISGTACLFNAATNTTCEQCLSAFVNNIAVCPAIMFPVKTQTTITYQFQTSVGLKTYTMELWTADGSTLLVSTTGSYSTITTVTGQFIGLTAGTTYRIRLVITVDGCSSPTTCPFIVQTTNPNPCPAPTLAEATIVRGPF